MKKLIISIAAVIITALSLASMTAGASAAAYPDAQSATITGRGVLYVKADTATINFGVETRDKDADLAEEQNKKITAAVRSIVGASGCVTEESYYSYEDPCTGLVSVSRYMTLITDRVNDIPALTQKLIDAGASCVNCVCYSVKDTAPYEDDVLKLAIADARSKAKELGLEMKLTEITELCSYSYYAGGCGQSPRGEVVIECNVNVTFRAN